MSAAPQAPKGQPGLGGGLKLVLIGDGESPHLLKWARALAPRVQLHASSSRGFLPEFHRLLPDAQRLALNTAPEHGGGNVALVKQLPKVLPGSMRLCGPTKL